MSELQQYGSRPVVWISRHEPLPNTCMSCGMFTDQRVAVRYAEKHQKTVTTGEETTRVALGCLLHLLGPVGWLLAAILHSGESRDNPGQKTVKLKEKIKVPVCRLCKGQTRIEPVEGNATRGQIAFEAHPRFQDELHALRRQSLQERE